MPLGDIAGEALGGVVRVVGRVLFEVIVEFVIQGAGYVLVRPFRSKTEPDDTVCTFVGVIFWVAVGAGSYLAYRATAA